MEKRGIAIFVLLVMGLFMISFASAEVFFAQQPRDTYSLGEQISFIIGSDGTAGWVNVDLKCGGSNSSSNSMVFFHYLTVDELSLPVSVPLTKEFLREMQGDCFFSMAFEDSVKETLHFDISSELAVDFSLDNIIYRPNETVQFVGSVVKKSGGDVDNAFAEVRFPHNGMETIVTVKNGEFKGEIPLQDNIPSGEYVLDIFVYEKDSTDAITNFFLMNSSISVLSEARLLGISVSDAGPDSDLSFTAYLYDQADETIDGVPVAFSMINPSGDQVLNLLSETGTTEYYKIQKNAPIGYWNLSAQAEGLDSEVIEIYILENVEAEFLIVNNTLSVRNIGNVPYDKFVEVRIGENYTRVLALNLSLGGSVEFDLEGPDGEYEIVVDDGKVNIGAIALLTGEVVGIKDSRSGGIGFLNRYVFSWVIIIGILGMFVFVSARKVMNRKSVAFPHIRKNKDKNLSKGGVVHVSKDNVESSVTIKESPNSYSLPVSNPKLSNSFQNNTADNSLVVQGDKQKATFLSFSVKNQQELEGDGAKNSMDNVVNLISASKGKVYRSGNHIIGVFAPSITKTFDNNIDVIKVADSIINNLREYNKKYTQKIKFGIGINTGEIIADNRNGKLLFTPLGNSIQVVKKISDVADNDLLLSEETNTSLNGQIRTIVNNSQGLKTYVVNDVLDKAQHAQFINKFLDRNYKKLDDFKV